MVQRMPRRHQAAGVDVRAMVGQCVYVSEDTTRARARARARARI